MASLKDLRTRIGSVKATKKITKAMQVVSAAKLRRAREQHENANHYCRGLESLFDLVSEGAILVSDPLVKASRTSGKRLFLVCSSERGLCGSFNSGLYKAASIEARKLQAQGETVEFFCVGTKATALLKREFGSSIVAEVSLRSYKYVTEDIIEKEIAAPVRERYLSGDYRDVRVFYSQFVSVIVREPIASQLVPLEGAPSIARAGKVDAVDMAKDMAKDMASDLSGDMPSSPYECEPDPEQLVPQLAPSVIASKIYEAILINKMSEESARMTAMDNANRNAGEMIQKLQLSYNRRRQAMITNELIEIISGAGALE